VTLSAGVAAALVVAVALIVAALGAWMLTRVGPVDAPGARTSHASPTPTSGGLCLIAGAALGAWVGLQSGGFAAEATPAVGAALLFASGAGVVGALDDMFDVDAQLKLLIGVVFASAFAWLAGPISRLPVLPGLDIPLAPWVGLGGAILWLVTASNAVNFMDGANGLAPGAMVVAFAALALAAFGRGAPAVGVCALAAAAAGCGFLPFNAAGRLFQGDAGALFSAFLFAALCLVAAGPDGRGPVDLYFGPVALMPFLTDVLLTLLRRARGRRRLFAAHREHLYQRWLQATGESHLKVSGRTAMIMAASGGVAVAAAFLGEAAQTLSLVLAVVLCTAGWTWAGRRIATAA
jgi:UDP-N-acetylmuramyl pentapeptide phosphotransferase/UDP-N-acetylglucosamine-1-phosphate transferase